DFQTIFHELNRLVTVDLSAFYFDVSKDRLYTFGATALERRSAQTAMYLMADGLTRLLAPILPVTADALWRELPGTREASVHIALFPDGLDRWEDAPRLDRWRQLLDVREAVNAKIEEQRKAQALGNSLEAQVILRASGHYVTLLRAHADQLAPLFIVSDVIVRGGPALEPFSVVAAAAQAVAGVPPRPADPGTLAIEVVRAPGVKCDRCWRYVSEVVTDGEAAGICRRCEHALGLAETVA